MVVTKESNVSLEPKFIKKVIKIPIFDRKVSKVRRFIIVCKLYIRMRMREESVEEQV